MIFRLPSSPFIVTALLCALMVSPALAQTGADPANPVTKGQGSTPRDEKSRDKETQRGQADEGAETTARRPYRAVYGGASKRIDLTRTLDFNGAITENYDQDRLAEATSPESSRLVDSGGFYSGLVGDLVFSRKGSRLEANVGGGANARYYPDLNRFLAADYHAGAGLSVRMTRRTDLRVNQAFSFAPVDLLGIFVSAVPPVLGEGLPVSTDYAVNDNRSYANSTSAQISRRMSPRGDLTFNGSMKVTRFLADRSGNNKFRELGGGGVYTYRLNTGANLRLGYGYRDAQYQGTSTSSANPAEHTLDIGVDLHRTLSDSRRTSFTLKTGSALLEAPTPTNLLVSTRQLRVLVDGSLAHQLGETWQLVGSYRRGSDIVEGLAGPIFSDAWTVSTNGFLARRADFTSALSYSTGEPSLATASQNFTAYTGNARLRVALNQRWATTAEYLHYFYDFSKTPQLAQGFNPRFSRNLFRVGLSLWVPFGRH